MTSPVSREVEQKILPCTDYEVCGQLAIALIPRWGMYLPCGLEKGHEGDCLPKSNCIRHGAYYGIGCPHWPTCAGNKEGERRIEFEKTLKAKEPGEEPTT